MWQCTHGPLPDLHHDQPRLQVTCTPSTVSSCELLSATMLRVTHTCAVCGLHEAACCPDLIWWGIPE